MTKLTYTALFAHKRLAVQKRPTLLYGYTLLEMIVSVAIFSLVMLLATGAYFTLIAVTREARATTTAMNTLAFAVDDMTRTIRTGSHFCTSSCTTTSFSLIDAAGNTVVYTLSGASIQKQVSGSGPAEASGLITDTTVSIQTLNFTVTGQNVSDALQPYVTIVIQGKIATGTNNKTKTFSVETSASERGVDLGP